ncbi:MAG: hypothetical protein K2X48_06490 [Chitinophagaceae bacterium]|nr:hypothetical protein [Chitinophagaceae bacterium]
MKLYLYSTLFFITVSFSSANAQTASGIINSYFKVTNFIPAYNGIRVQNITGLAKGDRVMIIQMKGASITSSNNSSFGNITADGGAGKYEFATICSFLNDTVVFERTLVNTYDYTQAVQLIYIPKYSNVSITGTYGNKFLQFLYEFYIFIKHGIAIGFKIRQLKTIYCNPFLCLMP